MGYREKINIYVSVEFKDQIITDAMRFEILKRDNRTVNRNRFLSMLLCGYHDIFRDENSKVRKSIVNTLSKCNLSESKRSEIAEEILKDDFLLSDYDKSSKTVAISLKPTADTEGIISWIEKEELAGRDSLSNYLRRMILSFFRKPMWERERILFQEKYQRIQDLCEEKCPIAFSLIKDSKQFHNVNPYKIAVGKDEMFNYLICTEINTKTNRQEVMSYRLSRIKTVNTTSNIPPITKELEKLCERTIKTAPQFAINSDVEICVELNDKGMKLYNRIYLGRPQYIRVQEQQGKHYYYFDCSEEQAFQYFRKFNDGTAIIRSPDSLVQRMIDFHTDVLAAYGESQKEDT
ncbi:MAG: WYL domain-containing protein [Ruminococcus sp.]|nr:WYL domain-containing protein [Ruminococcus sp.]